MSHAVEMSISRTKTVGVNKYSVPGWTDFVSEKQDVARQAFVDWVTAGKPKCGAIYQHMYTTRTAFKQVFSFCRKQKEKLQADACAQSLANKDSRQFWKNVSKIASKNLLLMLTKLVTLLGNLRSVICGEITSTSSIGPNSIHDNDSKNFFDSKCASSINNSCITVKEVMDAIRLQKKRNLLVPMGW